VPADDSRAPLARKLGVREGARLALIGAPAGWSVGGLPADVCTARDTLSSGSDVVVAFFSALADVQRDVESLAQAIVADGALWVAWPRRAGGHRSDITDNAIRAAALPLGLVDVKVAALDDDWSGLKMVWRKELRQGIASGARRYGAGQ
jgi:hypothetical protein